MHHEAEAKWSIFSHVYVHMHCLRVVKGAVLGPFTAPQSGPLRTAFIGFELSTACSIRPMKRRPNWAAVCAVQFATDCACLPHFAPDQVDISDQEMRLRKCATDENAGVQSGADRRGMFRAFMTSGAHSVLLPSFRNGQLLLRNYCTEKIAITSKK